MFCSTLFFFNIAESHSATTMISPSALCQTIHFNSSGEPIGTSKTVMQALYGPCQTTHLNDNGIRIGFSKTTMGGLWGPYHTTYYNNNKEEIGSSVTTRHSPHGPCDTTFYNNKKEIVGTSHTTMNTIMGPCQTKFNYHLPPSVSVLKPQINKPQQSDFNRTKFISQMKGYYLSKSCFFNASHKIFNSKNTMEEIIGILKNRALQNPGGASSKTVKHYNLSGDWIELVPKPSKKESKVASSYRVYPKDCIGFLNVIDEQRFVSHLKEYYLSQSRFFNASKNIFENRTMEQVIEALKERAKHNPGGASEKTVNYYKL